MSFSQALAPPEPEPEPWEAFAVRVPQDPVTAAQKLAIAQAVGQFAGGEFVSPAHDPCCRVLCHARLLQLVCSCRC